MGLKMPTAPLPPPPPGWSDEQKRQALQEYRDRLAKQYAEYDRRTGFMLGLTIVAVAMAAIGIAMIITGKL